MVCEGHWPACSQLYLLCALGLCDFPVTTGAALSGPCSAGVTSWMLLWAVVVSASPNWLFAVTGPSTGMAFAVQLPKCIYVEMLEEWLLLQAYSGLWRERGHGSLPPAALSMAVRNDIIHAAVSALEPGLCAAFLDYAERLQSE